MLKWSLPAVLAALVAGCVDPYGRPNYTGSGALIGGASGAGLGAIIDRRNPAAGALIGGAAGLVTGTLIGHTMDEDARRYHPTPPVYTVVSAPPAPPPPAPRPPPVGVPPTIEDIKAMVHAKIGDDTILNQIAASQAVYQMDTNTILDLKNAGVSENVIQTMIATGNAALITQAPPPAQVETIVVSPGPDYSWCGGEWAWTNGTWVWVPGRWVLRPYSGAVWVETRWEHSPYGWRRHSGHWR